MEKLSCGHIVNDPNQTHYCDYLHLADLLRLQPTRAEVRHPDEHLFVVTHQAFELWFAQLRFDLPRLIEALQGDDVALATWLAQRCAAVTRLFAPMMQVLETMTPTDFFAFRAHLSPASGTESQQWHEIEILAGLRDEAFRRGLAADLSPHLDRGSQVYLWTEELEALWAQPSVASAMNDLLAHRGVAAADIYQIAPQQNPHGDLMLLSEALMDFDEAFRLWRFSHARTAERSIGPSNEGTAHTSGVRYLDYVAFHRPHFFPALWEARSTLWQRQIESVEGSKNIRW